MVDFSTKHTAAQKLLFLSNEGQDISLCSFNVIELMGSNSIKNKRISYLIAGFALKGNEQILFLVPNIFKKDLTNIHLHSAASIAINCVATLMNENIAEFVAKDVPPLYTCSKPIIRKKVSLLSLKLFINNTDCVSTLVPLLADRIKDPQVGVQISAVTAILEISKINPKLFLVTIPHLFEVLD